MSVKITPFFIALLICAGFFSACHSSNVQSTEVAESVETEQAPQIDESFASPVPFLLDDRELQSPLVVSEDFGKNWQPAGEGLPWDAMINFMEKMDDELLIATDNYGVFKRDKEEKIWKKMGVDLPGNKVNAFHIAGKNMYVGLYKKGLYRSTDYGKTWESLNYNLADLRVQSILEFEDRLLVGTDTGIFDFFPTTNTWTNIFPEAQINSLNLYKNKIVAATHKGMLLSEDLGKNWSWIREEGAASSSRIIDGMIVEMNMNGQLHFSVDWGESWRQTISMPRFHASAFDLIQHKRKLYMTNRVGLLQSLDDGLNWEIIYESEGPGIMKIFIDGETMYGGIMVGC